MRSLQQLASVHHGQLVVALGFIVGLAVLLLVGRWADRRSARKGGIR